MEIVLVRHGETHDNLNRIVSGQTNAQLTELGIEQAQKAGPRLRNRDFDHVFVSDLQRAKDTAANILGDKEIQVSYDERIRERHMGEIQGQSYEFMKQFRVDPNVPSRDDVPGEPGESWNALMNRAGNFYEHLVKSYYTQEKEIKVLLVCHGGFIKEFINYVRTKAGKPAMLNFITSVGNVSIHVIKVVGDSDESLVPRYVIKNDVSHLT